MIWRFFSGELTPFNFWRKRVLARTMRRGAGMVWRKIVLTRARVVGRIRPFSM